MIRRCPGIEALEELASTGQGKAAKHVEKCVPCQGVLALMVDRAEADTAEECAAAEVLIALADARSDAQNAVLDAHLGECDGCSEIAHESD